MSDPTAETRNAACPEAGPEAGRQLESEEPVALGFGEGIEPAPPPEPEPATHSTALVVASLLSVYLAWGSTYLAIRVALEGMPPFLLAGLRGVVAGALLLAWGVVFGHGAVSRRAVANAAVVGVLLVTGGNGLVTWAEQFVASGLAAAIASSGSIWLVLMLAALGERPTRLETIGIAVGFTGIALLNMEGELRASPLGALALLGATLSWSLGSLLTRRMVLPQGAVAVGVELVAGGIVSVLIALASGERLVAGDVPARVWAAWLYLVFAGSIVGFSAFSFLMRNVRPALATSFVYVNPVVAVALGVLLAGETVTPVGYAGVAVSVGGLFVVTMSARRKPS